MKEWKLKEKQCRFACWVIVGPQSFSTGCSVTSRFCKCFSKTHKVNKHGLEFNVNKTINFNHYGHKRHGNVSTSVYLGLCSFIFKKPRYLPCFFGFPLQHRPNATLHFDKKAVCLGFRFFYCCFFLQCYYWNRRLVTIPSLHDILSALKLYLLQ